jgi:hypothetical protein
VPFASLSAPAATIMLPFALGIVIDADVLVPVACASFCQPVVWSTL